VAKGGERSHSKAEAQEENPRISAEAPQKAFILSITNAISKPLLSLRFRCDPQLRKNPTAVIVPAVMNHSRSPGPPHLLHGECVSKSISTTGRLDEENANETMPSAFGYSNRCIKIADAV
jgi:hypothetical protein